MNYIKTRNQYLKQINEGIFDFIKGKVQVKKLKKYLEEYKQQVSESYQKRKDLEFKIKISEKAGEDSDEFKDQLEILKDEEKNIKETIENEVNSVKEKTEKNKHSYINTLVLKAKKEVNEIKREILEKMSKDKKYEDFNEIVDDLKKQNQQNKEMDEKLKDFKKQVEEDSKEEEDDSKEEEDSKGEEDSKEEEDSFFFYTDGGSVKISKSVNQKGDTYEMENGDKIDKSNLKEIKKGDIVKYKSEVGDKEYQNPVKEIDIENNKVVIEIKDGSDTTDKPFGSLIDLVE